MLIFSSPCRTAVFFARIVMPFSRSRSVESNTRSATSWFARNAPDCQSIASTRVVLPWSTWATIATFRMSERLGMDTMVGGGAPPWTTGARTRMPVGSTERDAALRAVAELGWAEVAVHPNGYRPGGATPPPR
jgi:hypothetical protein